MTIDYFIKGFIIGFSVAAPVGPIGLLTVKRTLTEGRTSGFITGIGAATADSVYGAVAGFGLTAISTFLLTQAYWLKLLGGLFLIYLGVNSFIKQTSTKEANLKSKGLFNHFFSTFVLTVSNPSTILSFLAIFASIGIGSIKISYISSLTVVIGVFIGSAFWWLILSSLVNYFKSKITNRKLMILNKLSGLLLISFGLFSIFSCIIKQ